MLRRLRRQNGLRHLRNALGAFVWRRPLRFRPLSATAPFAPKDGAKGLRLRAGCAVPNPNAAGCFATGSVAPASLLSALRFQLRLKDQPSPSMASAFGGKTIHWIVFYSASPLRCRWRGGTGRPGFRPGLPRRRTALGFDARHPWRAPFGRTTCVQIRSRRICPTHVCLRLRSPSGAACPARFGGQQFNIMLVIMRSAKNALSGSRPQCCIMCLCLRLLLIPCPPLRGSLKTVRRVGAMESLRPRP